jgi:hypothetical protein
MEYVVIRLTIEQARKLADILNDTTDCGPSDEGWPSSELCALRVEVEDSIAMAMPRYESGDAR